MGLAELDEECKGDDSKDEDDADDREGPKHVADRPDAVAEEPRAAARLRPALVHYYHPGLLFLLCWVGLYQRFGHHLLGSGGVGGVGRLPEVLLAGEALVPVARSVARWHEADDARLAVGRRPVVLVVGLIVVGHGHDWGTFVWW